MRDQELKNLLLQFCVDGFDLTQRIIGTSTNTNIPYQISSRYTVVGENSVSEEKIQTVDWGRLVITNERAFQEMPSYVSSMGCLLAHPVVKGQLNVLIGTKSSRTTIDPNRLLLNLLTNLLSEKNDTIFNQQNFDELYGKLEDFFYEDTIKLRHFAPISNFALDVDKLELEENFSIIKISNKDRELLLSSSNAFSSNFQHLSFRNFAFEYITVEPKCVGEHELLPNEKITEQIVREKFHEVIGALRLFKSGPVGFNPIWEFNLGWSLYGGIKSTFQIRGATEFAGNIMSISSEEIQAFKELWYQYTSIHKKNKTKVITAIRRLGYGIERAIPEDQIVDFMIGFESLFLNDKNPELSFRLALFTAHWLGSSAADRERIFEIISEGYAQRSKVVHGGKLGQAVSISGTQKSIQELSTLVEEHLRSACKKFVIECNRTNTTETELVKKLKGQIIVG